ncbi:MAG: bifunctional DNA-formamidopyrimidine glycosylase/DNA-(apurinic or apyrimidinic site) lyase [Pseudomonadales bacterium]|nr:bifunctional DNA-formamidopyrimidine glycosylase/DNA-(apurinic or apyrimidinic site) lyase [Pseudomonadales bacterium]MDP6469442.1 bifunctional DNA-formamidopyrimidine glycosylase/DNA-(apurinic or apyrimidinic site) lyase [Pseudomonadales bacterium]MDP6827284.1 bifunctional DNA-formamidopyrimidine glycosylase/DNA-(apurinic or apyrimidinic site) lyase [Pseudomonadales bacterium]MDP6971107.1 bifunctional DNA-formamidopyrimidine glycosylase/DNA-(apurinic or apyrimidinic site) lyase [Pseudomonada
MPELPEVETTRRGISPHVRGRRLTAWIVRNANLRWPVEIPNVLKGALLDDVERRGKYLLLRFERGTLLIHLGMSGSLRIVDKELAAGRHDHVDLVFDTSIVLRLNDPRRFGSVLWWPASNPTHPLLAHLGVEPLSDAFDAHYLRARARNRRVAVKNYIMNAHIVVGVGNIYASEALYLAGIRPDVPAGQVTRSGYDALVRAIRFVLERSLREGGTTLRDFVGSDGRPGYFQQQLNVYGRGGEVCRRCATRLKSTRVGQRGTVFCPKCQRSRGFRPLM